MTTPLPANDQWFNRNSGGVAIDPPPGGGGSASCNTKLLIATSRRACQPHEIQLRPQNIESEGVGVMETTPTDCQLSVANRPTVISLQPDQPRLAVLGLIEATLRGWLQ